MKEALKGVVVGLFGSKKFVALLVGLLVTMLTYPLSRWMGMSEEEAAKVALPIATKLMGLVSAYMLSQGVADMGKEAKKTSNPDVKVR